MRFAADAAEVELRRAPLSFGPSTVTELLAVIAIVAVLGVTVLIGVRGVSRQASQTVCRADVRAIDTANASYRAMHGTDAPDVLTLQRAGYLVGAAPAHVTFADGVATATAGCH